MRLKLNYLIQYCEGDAKRAVRDCAILNPEVGYFRALEILQQTYGRPHVISHSYIDELVNGPALKPNDFRGLGKLALQMQQCEITLNQLGYSADMNNSENLLCIARRLPLHLRAKWAERADSYIQMGLEPKFTQLCDFIQNRARVASSVYGKDLEKPKDMMGPKKVNTGVSSRQSGKTFATRADGNKNSLSAGGANKGSPNKFAPKHLLPCQMCGGNHSVWECQSFIKKSVDERHMFMRKNGLCNNCAQPGHFGKGCMLHGACTHCKGKHNTLLHGERKTQTQSSNPGNHASSQSGGSSGSQGSQPLHSGIANLTTVSQGPSTSVNEPSEDTSEKGGTYATSSVSPNGASQVNLKVLPVRVVSGDSCYVTYAMLDDCSDVSLCTDRLVESLGLKGASREYHLTTVNGEGKHQGKEVSLVIESLDEQEQLHIEKAWTVKTIQVSADNVPRKSDIHGYSHLEGLEFPEISCQNIDLLIGANVPEAFWNLGDRRGKKKEPYAVKTPLGWTLIGPVGRQSEHSSFHVNFTSSRSKDMDIQKSLQRLWNMDFPEASFSTEPTLSIQDKQALHIMNTTVKKQTSGHYQLSLPWKKHPPDLHNNRPMAEKRLQGLKRRLERDQDLHIKYSETMKGNIDKGYVTEVPIEKREEGVWFLPHHPVIHPRKPGKVRIVYDCAAKSGGQSLNDQLLKGPENNNTLVGVLLRFREGPYAISADIEGMFNQIEVTPDDRKYLRFLWWRDGNLSSTPQQYEVNVHLFGATSSPSVAGYCLRKVADDATEFSDDTLRTVHKNFYVDDCLKSSQTREKSLQLVKELPALLSSCGFKLTKWAGNDEEVLSQIAPENRTKPMVDLVLDDKPGEHVLGVKWDVDMDAFLFESIHKEHQFTRRGILSTVSTLYDPLGLVAPWILPAKVLLQDLCRKQLGWDTPLSADDVIVWQRWLQDLDHISQIKIPRCFTPLKLQPPYRLQLHNFSDASETGYGCVSYIRAVDANGCPHVTLVMGKSRVTPLKVITIPRLELTAAAVAVKQDKMIRKELDLELEPSVFWTDSTSVLQYLANDDRRFQTFVANRVSLIHENTSRDQWRHVNTSLNPADHASRGLGFTEPQKMDQWLQGPAFLWKPEDQWPEMIKIPGLSEDDKEVKKSAKVYMTSQEDTAKTDHPMEYLIQRKSTWMGLLKSVAWLLRLKTILRHRAGHMVNTPSAGQTLKLKEIRQAEATILKFIQIQEFPEEISCLSTIQENETLRIKTSSSLKKLSPVLVDGILRVGGRLERASLEYEEKHPAILPKRGQVTDLIVRHFHEVEGHSGANHVLTRIRMKYWIVNGLAAVRRIIGKCIFCRKRAARLGQQIMAPLPENRLRYDEAPFSYTGVDYFGPVFVKSGRSLHKRYGCIFTCLSCRAVHIEIAHSLETDSFLCALMRFISRRGKPKEISSDNGTNFKGGDKELRDAIKQWNSKRISDFMLQRNIEWNYNPPTASHMGGAWERLIRSIRHVLKAVLDEQRITDESLVTAIAEVEKILNDRPLTSVENQPDDLRPLTPNQVLLLRSNSSLPPGLFSKEDCYGKRRWRQAQYLANLFWRRWMREYLPSLQARQKWTSQRRNFAVNDLVLIGGDNVPRGQWPLARIVETFPDKHGHVRSVRVHTASGDFVRPVTALCLLEGHHAEDEAWNDPGDTTEETSGQEASRSGTSSGDSRPVRATRDKRPAYLKDYV